MNTTKNDEGIDKLLRSYYRREMPSRWPDAPRGDMTTVAAAPVASSATMSAGRFLVGISLAAILALYIGVSAFFPREQSTGLNPNSQPIIGQRPGIEPKLVAPKAVPAPQMP